MPSSALAGLRADFDEILGSIVYATMTTVDKRHRPRSRVLIPVWEVVKRRVWQLYEQGSPRGVGYPPGRRRGSISAC